MFRYVCYGFVSAQKRAVVNVSFQTLYFTIVSSKFDFHSRCNLIWWKQSGQILQLACPGKVGIFFLLENVRKSKLVFYVHYFNISDDQIWRLEIFLFIQREKNFCINKTVSLVYIAEKWYKLCKTGFMYTIKNSKIFLLKTVERYQFVLESG